MRYRVTILGRAFDVLVEEDERGTLASVVRSGEEKNRAPLERRSLFARKGPLSVLEGEGGALTLSVRRLDEEGIYEVRARGGRPLRCEVEDERRRLARAAGPSRAASSGPRVIRSVMPGIVVKVLATPGLAVAAKDSLLVVEAMKMQNEIRCEEAGVVAKVHVKPGQSVPAGAPLVELTTS